MYNDPRYQLIETVDSPETGSTGFRYRHKASGAEILWLKNDDENKAFGVGFRTPPADSTGVAHIVEHSVLSGSRKFKGREPFMEMYKSSMQTFLNAMTFSDMTLYPISSKNNQDFLNLTDVYLDAVFFPGIYDKPEIFMQEGWHHELSDPDEPVTYKGVVYNEMRGAYGNPERQVLKQMTQTLHPDGTYSHESGGFPYDVPKLTPEAFLAFHKRFYHPSNALIYLYGDIPLQETFDLLDIEYLSLFEQTDPDSQVDPGTVLSSPKKAEHYYNAASGADETAESYFGYNVILGESVNLYDAFMQPLVTEVLISSESSPLKQALLEKKFGQAIFPAGADGFFQEFGFVVKGADSARFDEFIELTESLIQKMVNDGVDQAALLAALNRTEMSLRESGGALKGIYFFIRAMGAHRYGVNPMEALNFNQTFDQIRKDLENGGFEKYVQDRILDNPAKVMTLHRPQPGQFKQLDAQMQAELKQYKDSLTQEQIDQLIQANQKLLKYQQTEDSPEDKATIPRLSLNDIQSEVAEIHSDKQTIGPSRLLIQEYPSMGIRYLQLAFDLDFVTNQELPYLAYLSRLLGIVDTEKTGYSELNNQIYQVSSGFGFSPTVLRPVDGSAYKLKMIVSTSALSSQSDKMIDVLTEVLTQTRLTDGNRIKDILQNMRSDLEMGFEQSGNSLAANRALSYFSPTAKINEQLGGIDLFDHLQELLSDYENRQTELMEHLQSLYRRIFTSKGLIGSLTMDPTDRVDFVVEVERLIQNLPLLDNPSVTRPFEAARLNEGITTASGVQYVAKAGNFKQFGMEYSGEMVVLKNILSRDYLHNLIRAQGGAYGAGLRIDSHGEVAATSYRDPNLTKTLEVFDGLSQHLANLQLDQADVTAAIVGSVMEFDPVWSASSIGGISLSREITGMTTDLINQRLNQALASTPESLKQYADMFHQVMAQNNLMVFGNEAKIQSDQDVFKHVRPLKKKADLSADELAQ